MMPGELYEIDPVNEILNFYHARIATLDLIGEFGEKEVLGALRAAASERQTGEKVLKWSEHRLTDRIKGRSGE
jgi:hypothetical protein